MEILREYWFIFTFLVIVLVYAINYGIKHNEHQRDYLSAIIILGIILSPILLDISNPIVKVLYYHYLGVIVLCAYWIPEKAIIFRGLVGVSKTFFYPGSKHWLLLVGLFLIFAPLLQMKS